MSEAPVESLAFTEYYKNLKRDEEKLINKALAPGAKNINTMTETEITRKRAIIDKLGEIIQILDLLSEIKKMEPDEKIDTENLNFAASTIIEFDKLEANEREQVGIISNKEMLDNYLAKYNINPDAKHLENQILARCGIHAINHVFQEQKIICNSKYPEAIYFDKKTGKPWARNTEPSAKDRNVTLNIHGICKIHPEYECYDDPCNMINIGLLQEILTGAAIDESLPKITLDFRTTGIDFTYDQLSEKRQEEFYEFEALIKIEKLKIMLMESDTIGAIINLNDWHYTAIVNSHGLALAPLETDFTYIDSIDKPCVSIKKKTAKLNKYPLPNFLKTIKNTTIKNKKGFIYSGNYKYENLEFLIMNLLQNEKNDGNINITVIKYKKDGTSYFSKSLENILVSKVSTNANKL